MSALALLFGLALVPVLDPESRGWISAQLRARRAQRLRAAEEARPTLDRAVSALDSEASALEHDLASQRAREEDCVKHGWDCSASYAREEARKLKHRLDTLYKGGATRPKGAGT